MRYGPKADTLRLLSGAGLPVPDAFYLCTSAYRNHARAAGVDKLLDESDGPLDAMSVAEAIVAQPVAGDVVSQLRLWFADLGGAFVAVRSSANVEDLADASFAGQHGTYFVEDADSLVTRVRDCWASLYSERAVRYRERKGVEHGGAEMGVIVQRLVPAKAAGVAFTLDPLTGSSDIKIESCLGIGEALVSGKVTPDRFTVQRLTMTMMARELGTKHVRVVLDGTGAVTEESVSAKESAAYSIDESTVLEVARLALHAEELLGKPADVEWAYDGERVWLLQARPITTLAEKQPQVVPVVWSNVNTGEILPDVASPFTWSVIHGHANEVFGGMFGAFGIKVDAQKVIGLVGGRIYFNLSLIRESFAHIPTMDLDRVLGGMHDFVELPPELKTRPERKGGRRALLRAAVALPGYIRRHSARKAGPYARLMRNETDAAFEGIADVDSVKGAHDILVRLVRKFEKFNDTLAFMAVAMIGFGVLGKLCEKWLGDESGAIANKLVSGRKDVASAAAGTALWDLAVAARSDDAVREAVLADGVWDEVRERLGTPAGEHFLTAWDLFMAEYGHHRRGELEFYNPTWAERPDYILGIVRSYLTREDAEDPMALYERRSLEADELAEKCRGELHSPLKRAIFEKALRWGRSSAGCRENLKNEAVRWLAAIRYVMLVLGEHLAEQGALVSADDVFFLTYEELESVASGGEPPSLGALVARRRAEHDYWQRLSPPPVVVGDWDERSGGLSLPDDLDVMKGISVSAGVARGPARVFLSADTDDQVLPGEILVAPFTDPGWTPYFVPAAGIVMDMGGMLSHGSIIAREYGIPAVVNVGPATKIIVTGQLVEVDGDRGEVRLLERARTAGEQ